MGKAYDFSGWATKANVRCSDGRTILNNAFKDCDGKTVPLVWNHQHDDPNNILGHALLRNRGDGVYAYGYFNSSESGQAAKILVEHGDISSMSILANHLTQQGNNVVHGIIREVSLVLAGANPKACIDDVVAHGDIVDIMAHGETGESYSRIRFYEPISLEHGELEDDPVPEDESASISHAEDQKEEKTMATEPEKKPESEETVADVFNTLNEKQKKVVYAMIGQIIEDSAGSEEDDEEDDNTEGGNNTMKHNVFDQQNGSQDDVLTHSEINTIIKDAKRLGSMRESVMQHAEEYGIQQIDYLIPDPKATSPIPEFIQRDMGWVSDVMSAVHRVPFSRIKSLFADITEDEARAKGYLKGKLKKEEVFGLLKRTTSPTTIYKKQKMDRDDIVDITDFDVVAWLKKEMRTMLDEEIARAVLIGDGRLASSDDKINEQCIRPVYKDAELFTLKSLITVSNSATPDDKVKAFIRAAIKARKDYKGSGNPVLYTTEDFLTDMLLLTDATGRDLFDSVEKLAKKLRVSKIVTVPVMEGVTNDDGDALMGIIVNLADYSIGADKGGAINMFDDFDIDYNQQKYLIETRCSGALTKPHSAIVLEMKVSG